jgi:hypothetical protein
MFDLWNSLQLITRYEVESSPGSGSQMEWRGNGAGRVTVFTEETAERLYFKEEGTFTLAQSGHRMNAHNEFGWERIGETRIKLSHSRFGRDQQVELFDLVYDDQTGEWRSEAAHVCGEDLYSGNAAWRDGHIEFFWSITGPRKQEHLHYIYSR